MVSTQVTLKGKKVEEKKEEEDEKKYVVIDVDDEWVCLFAATYDKALAIMEKERQYRMPYPESIQMYRKVEVLICLKSKEEAEEE